MSTPTEKLTISFPILETTTIGTIVRNMNLDTHLIADRDRQYFIHDNEYFCVDDHYLKLKKEVSFDDPTTNTFTVEVNAHGNKHVFPHFHKRYLRSFDEVSMLESTGLFGLVRWLKSWELEWIEEKNYQITYTISVQDVGITLETQELPTDKPIELAGIKQRTEIGAIVTLGDKPKSAWIDDENDKNAFYVQVKDDVIKLFLFNPDELLQRKFIRLGSDNWLYPVNILVSDKSNNTNPVTGVVNVKFHVHRDSQENGTINFEELVSAADKISPLKKLSEIMNIAVPETSERNLMEISNILQKKLK